MALAGDRLNKGFTLLEILVALALASLIVAALYRSFFSALKARDRVASSVDRAVEAARFLDNLSMELRSAFYSGKNRFTSFQGENPVRDGLRSGSLFFTSAQYGRHAGGYSGGIILLRYTVGKEKNGSYAVFKEMANPYAPDERPFRFAAIGDIEGFEVEFFNGTEWVKAWDSSLEGAQPVAARARLSLMGGKELGMTASIMARP